MAIMETDTYIGQGIYSISRASFIVRANQAAVRRWITGNRREDGQPRPLLEVAYEPVEGRTTVSFLDLIEIRLVTRLRAEGVSLQRLRQARSLLSEQFGVRHPFAWGQLRTDGRDVFAKVLEEDSERVIQASGRNRANYVLPEVVEPYFRNIDFARDSQMAERVYPFGRDGGILIDARVSFGEPVLSGSRIPTLVLAGFARAGDSAASIARWYGIEPGAVETARVFESGKEWAHRLLL